MLKKLKTFLTSLATSTLLFAPAMAPAVVYAQDDEIGPQLCSGADLEFNLEGTDCEEGDTENRVNDMIKLVINIFSVIVGVVAVVMIIYGGLKYITSGGEGSNISGAKNTILYAIIGLVIVALAQLIVRFVLSKTVTS